MSHSRADDAFFFFGLNAELVRSECGECPNTLFSSYDDLCIEHAQFNSFTLSFLLPFVLCIIMSIKLPTLHWQTHCGWSTRHPRNSTAIHHVHTPAVTESSVRPRKAMCKQCILWCDWNFFTSTRSQAFYDALFEFVSFRHLMAQQIFGPDYTSDKQGTSWGIAGTLWVNWRLVHFLCPWLVFTCICW